MASTDCRKRPRFSPEDIKTNQADALLDIKAFADQCIEEEKRRGDTVESKIAILAGLGGASIGGIFAINVLAGEPSSAGLVKWLYVSSILASFIFALRCLYYVVRAVEGRGRDRLVPDLVIREELKGTSREEDLKALITWRLWELRAMVPLHSTRLYFVSCASWAIAACYMYLAIGAGVLLAPQLLHLLDQSDVGRQVTSGIRAVGQLKWLWIGIHWISIIALFAWGNSLMRRWSIWGRDRTTI